MPSSIRTRYHHLADQDHIEKDPAQLDLIERFVRLSEELKQKALLSKKSALGWLFAKGKRPQPVKGLYIWGDVGRGKTMLMDLFYEEAPVQDKQRFHFHAFMADIHERIHVHRTAVKAGEIKDGDPINPIADALSDKINLLCFDEFYVIDIADAMILGRLFSRLFENGVTLVATSNVRPDELYPDGLNRELFLPFIDLLKTKVDVVELTARTDFRLEKLGQAKTYFWPLNEAAAESLDGIWRDLTGVLGVASAETIQMKGRLLNIPQGAQGVARASFDEWCNKPLGASDYLAIAQRYHTVILDGIPTLSRNTSNAARRFINLVDALYNYKVKLVVSAQASPEKLYSAQSGNELFAFERTASRLIEMQSLEYLALPHGQLELG